VRQVVHRVTHSLRLDVQAGEKRGHIHVDMAIIREFVLSALDLSAVINSYDDHLA